MIMPATSLLNQIKDSNSSQLLGIQQNFDYKVLENFYNIYLRIFIP